MDLFVKNLIEYPDPVWVKYFKNYQKLLFFLQVCQTKDVFSKFSCYFFQREPDLPKINITFPWNLPPKKVYPT